MSSLRRILSSRANGARSRGPKTLEGKQRSSRNAIRHGLLAKCVLLGNESRECFESLLAQHLDRYGPVDGVELGFIEEMVAASWRLRRIWATETRLLDNAIQDQQSPDELGRLAAAFSTLASTPELALIHRYETRLHTIYQRSLYNLLLLRTAMPNEPSSISANAAPVPPALPAP